MSDIDFQQGQRLTCKIKLQNAYDTISDPAKRREYDSRWSGIRDSLRAQQESERRRAEAARTEQKMAAEERSKRQKEDHARQERLRLFALEKSKYDSDIFELSRVIRKLTADLKHLQDQDDEDSRRERERGSWWVYLMSPVYGRVEETDEQKQVRKFERVQRGTSRRIKESELDEKGAKLQKLQYALQDVNDQIAAEKKKAEDEKRKMENEARVRRARMEQDNRDREMRGMREMLERMAKARKEAAERAAKEAREACEAQAAREAREAQERARMAAAAAERRRREVEERAQEMRRAEAAARKPQETRNDWPKRTTKSTCRHDRFWPKVEGRQLCSNCDSVQGRFAFQCPGCSMVACANCRQILRGEKGKNGGASRRQGGFVRNHDYDYYD